MAKTVKVVDWERLLADASILQLKIPGAVLVGGTAAALHAKHRVSFDHDHVIKDLDKDYDRALMALQSIVGWRTRRTVRGKLVLGEIAKIAAGLRNQRRATPLETLTLNLPGRRRLRIPTVEEMLRIKTFLIVDRNATRDYLDVAALSHHLGSSKSAMALANMNALYSEFAGEGGDMLSSIVVKLSQPDPYDIEDVDLSQYKGITAPWNDWAAVERQCRSLAVAILT